MERAAGVEHVPRSNPGEEPGHREPAGGRADAELTIGRALDSATPHLVAALAVRLAELGDQIEVLRGRRRTILSALAAGREGDRTWSLDKASLVDLLDGAGIGSDRQEAWHVTAEQADGDLHQRLLESLDIPADEVARIRRGRPAGLPV